jgi:dihydrofolate synthase/folylpolyglutamate synthase
VLRRRALEVGAVPVLVEPGSVRDVDVSAHGTSATLTLFGELRRLRTPLTGAHQAYNLAFALTLLHASGAPYAFSLSEAEPLLTEVSLPGRFQRHGGYIFDVAHNADGAKVLAATVRAVEPDRPLVVLFCALRDKEWSEMIRTLASVADAFVLTNAPTAPASRAWNLDEALDFTRREGIRAEAVPGFDDALRAVDGGGTVLVTGSFHTVGDAMARLQVSPFAS